MLEYWHVNQMDLLPIAEFIALVKTTDEDADHRLRLLDRAAPILYADVDCPKTEREFLAEKLERWRYQRLNKFGARLSDNERQLVTMLDLAMSKILQSPRPQKETRSVLMSSPVESKADRGLQLSTFAKLETVFDPRVALDKIAQEAAAVTSIHFASEQSTATDSTEQTPGRDEREPRRRWQMRLYAPLYLSNYCVNHCLYCGFRFPNEMERVHLSVDQAIAEAEILSAQGHRHLLIVAGDFPKLTSTDYLAKVISALAARDFDVSVEVAAQGTVAYKKMERAGATGVTLYQETYQEGLYNRLHPRGPKVWFDWRLEALERAAEAGMKRIGLGILLGLADPLVDLRSLIRHGQYLCDRFPEIKLAFSLPRIHEAPDSFQPEFEIDDETFIRLYCALRFYFPDADLVLSTRESPMLRDQLAKICITQMSAGSCTAPGGYSEMKCDSQRCEQFPVFDHRTTAEVADSLVRSGFDVRWQS